MKLPFLKCKCGCGKKFTIKEWREYQKYIRPLVVKINREVWNEDTNRSFIENFNEVKRRVKLMESCGKIKRREN